MKHTKEPTLIHTEVQMIYRTFGHRPDGFDVAKRIVECFDACTGIPNPAAVAGVIEVLRESADSQFMAGTKLNAKAKAALSALEKEEA